MKGISGRTAVLSGAAKLTGIGYAFSKGLAAAGANIVIADVLDGSAAAKSIQDMGQRASYVKCDVSKQEDVDELARFVDREYGGCDILIHAAALFGVAPVDDMSFGDWRRVLSVNLDGMFLLAHAFVPGMKQRRWGRIIPISSTTYHAGAAMRTHYVSSKAGLIGFTRSLAHEVGNFGITVNTMAPGLVLTERTEETSAPPEPRFAGRDIYEIVRDQQSIGVTLLPEHLVGPLLFLASDESAYMTGQTILVDGGWYHVG